MLVLLRTAAPVATWVACLLVSAIALTTCGGSGNTSDLGEAQLGDYSLHVDGMPLHAGETLAISLVSPQDRSEQEQVLRSASVTLEITNDRGMSWEPTYTLNRLPAKVAHEKYFGPDAPVTRMGVEQGIPFRVRLPSALGGTRVRLMQQIVLKEKGGELRDGIVESVPFTVHG